MHGFPEDLSPSVFENKRLHGLYILENCVFLHFEEEVDVVPLDRALVTAEIRVDSCLTYTTPDGTTERETMPLRSINLNTLVGAVVTRATVDVDSTLTLQFRDGRVLCCHEDLGNVECYNITFDGRTYYV